MASEEDDDFVDFDLSDFDYFVSALGLAEAEGFTLEDILVSIYEAETGAEFDAGVWGLSVLKGIVDDHNTREKEA